MHGQGRLIFLWALLFAVSCGRKDVPVSYNPAVRVQLESCNSRKAVFSLDLVQCAKVNYGYGTSDLPALTLTVAVPSDGPEQLTLTVEGLSPDTDYVFSAQGTGPGGEEGKRVNLSFTTPAEANHLYSWEKARDAAPEFADISLITRGQHNSNPPLWTADRFAPHVSYQDADGEHWLFDAFLCTEGYDGVRGLTMSIQTGGRASAIKYPGPVGPGR